MADEEVVAVASPAPSDHKRKLEDLEPEEAPEPNPNSNSDSISELNSVDKPEDETLTGGDSDGSEAKRPRLEDKIDGPGIDETLFLLISLLSICVSLVRFQHCEQYAHFF